MAIRSVVTWAAMDRILQFSPERLQQWEDQGQLDVMHWTAGRRLPLDLSTLHAARGAGPRLDVLAACRRLQLPQLIVMGDADRSLEFAVAERLHQAGGKHSQLLRIPSGDHTFGTQHPCPGPLPPMLSTVLNATGNHFARHG